MHALAAPALLIALLLPVASVAAQSEFVLGDRTLDELSHQEFVDLVAWIESHREALEEVAQMRQRHVSAIRSEADQLDALVASVEDGDTRRDLEHATEQLRVAMAEVDRAKHEFRKAARAIFEEIDERCRYVPVVVSIAFVFLVFPYVAAAVRHHCDDGTESLLGALGWSAVSALAALMLDVAAWVRGPHPAPGHEKDE